MFLKKYSLHIVVALLAGMFVLLPGSVASAIQGFATWFLYHFDWLTLTIATGAIIACIAVAAGPWGKLKLGGPAASPDFSRGSWFAMLFAAGMGSGLVFWGAAEPLIFTLTPPPGGAEAESVAAMRDAYALTMFHWGLHAWAIYAVVALAVAYTALSTGRPLLPSAPFAGAPRWLRRLVDWLALFAVIFGVVASLGQGAFQMTAGFRLITGIEDVNPVIVQLGLLTVLTVVFLSSSLGGIRHGIKPLSNANMMLAIALVLFAFFAGNTGGVFSSLWEMGSAYVQQLIPLSAELRPEGAGRQWTRDWSLTYFLWWVAWTPFVGVFIARISKGRSLREFVIGVVLLPTIVTLVWFGVFGGVALDLQLEKGVDLGVRDFATAPAASYVLFAQLPLAEITQILVFLLVFIFLVTSADSGAYVMAMLSSEAAEVPPPVQRFFWGMILSLLTVGAILSRDGQDATRAMAVVGAIPLTFLMVLQVIAVARQIWRDWRNS